MKKFMLLPLVASISLPVMALPKMGEPGFNGVVNFGAMGGEMESNFLANIDGFNVDLSEEKIDDLGSPDAESFVTAMAKIDIGWTFSNGKTRISLGNDFTDVLEFDRSTRVSLRHDFDSIGQIRLDALQPTGLATQVYRDPYLTGEDRPDTEQEVSGGRFTWDRIFGSGFGIQALVKNRDVDEEDSGASISGLTDEERRLLDREGDILNVELSYNYKVDEWHSVRPAVSYIDRDLDGGAMAQDGYSISLNHFYISDDLEWGTQIAYTDLDGDETNPIFNQTHNSDGFAVATIATFPNLLDFLGKWKPNVQLAYAEQDSDINFNDSSIWTVSAGLARRF